MEDPLNYCLDQCGTKRTQHDNPLRLASYTEKPQEPKKLRDHRLFRRMFASKQAAT